MFQTLTLNKVRMQNSQNSRQIFDLSKSLKSHQNLDFYSILQKGKREEKKSKKIYFDQNFYILYIFSRPKSIFTPAK